MVKCTGGVREKTHWQRGTDDLLERGVTEPTVIKLGEKRVLGPTKELSIVFTASRRRHRGGNRERPKQEGKK